MDGNVSLTSIDINSLLQYLLPIIVSLIIILVIRILLGRLISTLYRRGIISVGTKITLTRIFDTGAIIAAIIVVLQAYTMALTTYLVVFLLAVFIITMFYYEIKGFTAYISLQLLKYIKGKFLEIRLPNQFKPIYGRIVSMEPFSSTIEDVSGDRIYVANSLLVNAVVKEAMPSIPIRIRVSISDENTLREVVNDIVNVFKRGLINVFRVNESRIMINRVTNSEVEIMVNAITMTIPIRLSDIVKLLDVLRMELRKYNPVIEIAY